MNIDKESLMILLESSIGFDTLPLRCFSKDYILETKKTEIIDLMHDNIVTERVLSNNLIELGGL